MILLITKYNLSPRWVQIIIFLLVYFIFLNLFHYNLYSDCMYTSSFARSGFGRVLLNPETDPIGAEIYKIRSSEATPGEYVSKVVSDQDRFRYLYMYLENINSGIEQFDFNQRLFNEEALQRKVSEFDSKLDQIAAYMNENFEQDRVAIKNYMTATDAKIEDLKYKVTSNYRSIRTNTTEISQLKYNLKLLEDKIEQQNQSIDLLHNLVSSLVSSRRK